MKRNDSLLMRHLLSLDVLPRPKILEIGCGNGELTQHLSELAGPDGIVLAIDNNEKILEKTQNQIKSFKFQNVKLIECDINCLPIELNLVEENTFDLLVGRRILMYLSQPATVIKELSKYLKKGGMAIFQESDPTIAPACISNMPAHDQATEWIRAMLAAENVHMAMGFNLPKTLIESGLEFKKVFAEAVIQGQGEQFLLSDMIKVLTQRLIATGIAQQPAINNLIEDIKDEACEQSKVYISDMSFCAWANKL